MTTMLRSCSRRYLRKACTPTATRLFHSSPRISVLHSEWIGSTSDEGNNNNNETIVFLHGLLGNGRNLKTLAKKVVETHNNNNTTANKQGLLLDLRGHGRSDSIIEGPHTFSSCVRDVHSTLSTENTPTKVMGHSWGGRIALEYTHSLLSTTDNTDTLPSLWLLDTVPGQAHDSVLQVLLAVESIDLVNMNRNQVAQRLVDVGLDVGIAQWLASTLKQDRTTKALSWGFNVEVVREILPEFHNQDFVGMLRDILKEGGGSEVHLIKGGLNTAWDESPRIQLQLQELQEEYPWQFEQHLLPNAGHWVHVDDLPGLLNIVEEKTM